MSNRFIKIVRRENETEFLIPLSHIQRFTGTLLLLLGLGAGLLFFPEPHTFRNNNLEDFLSPIPFLIIIVIFLILSVRMLFDKPRLIIDLENVRFKSNGYTGQRKKTYPRSDFLRIDRNFVLESKFSQEYPTLELQFANDAIRLICADVREQEELELLLREIFQVSEHAHEPREAVTPRGFHVQVYQEDQKLVLEQPPEEWNWVAVFFLVVLGSCFVFMFVGWLMGEFNNPRNRLPWWGELLSVLSVALLYGYLVFMWIRDFWGRFVYTFERRTLTIDFACPGFHRQWIYYYADIQSVKPDENVSRRGGERSRFVALKVSGKTYRITVRSEEEQQYLCSLIRQILAA